MGFQRYFLSGEWLGSRIRKIRAWRKPIRLIIFIWKVGIFAWVDLLSGSIGGIKGKKTRLARLWHVISLLPWSLHYSPVSLLLQDTISLSIFCVAFILIEVRRWNISRGDSLAYVLLPVWVGIQLIH